MYYHFLFILLLKGKGFNNVVITYVQSFYKCKPYYVTITIYDQKMENIKIFTFLFVVQLYCSLLQDDYFDWSFKR